MLPKRYEQEETWLDFSLKIEKLFFGTTKPNRYRQFETSSLYLRKQEHQEPSKMHKAKALFARKKTSTPFKYYYADWFSTLTNNLLPLLRRSISHSSFALLSAHVDSLLHHFLSYYHALDAAASCDVAQLLYPDWRNSIEKPFLWLGDFHPYLFTNLLRSFLDDPEDDSPQSEQVRDNPVLDFCRSDKPWQIAMAWENPSGTLINRVEQIERGLRLMVPAMISRMRTAQEAFVVQLAESRLRGNDSKKEAAKVFVEEAMADETEEMVSVFVDANRLRRSVLTEIIGATSVYQAALFLEGLAQFIVGFRDGDLVCSFERCKVSLGSSQSWPQL